MYKFIVRPILFGFNPELAHKIIATFLKLPLVKEIISLLYNYQNKGLEIEFCGISFKNPVGLAAGFDKDANLLAGMSKVGFGFIEIGTLTPLAQPGNPQPRLFRLPKDDALINRMGFNNKGVDEAIQQLKKFKKGDLIIGGNIGKNKVTPLDQAVEDYKLCFSKLHPFVDYFVVNVSSPNTPNLRQLQDKKPLSEILTSLMALNENIDNKKPILLKIAPDLNENQLDDIIEIVKETGIAGIVATNTTISRENLTYSGDYIERIGAGGLSGKPLTKRATEVIRYISEKSNKSIPIMAAGGIHTAKDALEKLEAGASLVQVYSGFIFEGPAIVRKINKGILKNKVN